VITSDPMILEIVSGWKLPIKGRPHQVREPREMSQTEKRVVDKEIQSILEKIDIKRTCQLNRDTLHCRQYFQPFCR